MANEKPTPPGKVKPAPVSPLVDDDFDDDVSQWLEKANEDDFSKRREDPDTRRFRLDATDDIPGGSAGDKTKSDAKPDRKTPLTAGDTKDSIEAAVDGLRRMFGRK